MSALWCDDGNTQEQLTIDRVVPSRHSVKKLVDALLPADQGAAVKIYVFLDERSDLDGFVTNEFDVHLDVCGNIVLVVKEPGT